MEIGDRIKSARKALKISQEALAEIVGLSQSAVGNWESGINAPRRETIKDLAMALNVTPEWLEFGGAINGRGSAFEPPPNANPVISAARPKSDDLRPIYSSVHTVDGEQILAPGEVVEWRAPPQRWDSVKGLYGFYVVGDSMEPRINPGEMVWIHPHRKPGLGQEAVFIRRSDTGHNTPIMVKVFIKATAAFWVVRQYNPPKEFQLRKDEWDCQLIVDIDLNR
ncbi:MAG: hypothetical protein A3E78_11140 [Alphaproteobacteria bacterium RIFCSPHIGHO2_12_FULL_63_12]|nr:MAG: hypothetical protein A3E78_11140 [Alphaproteobacteria bacterium RIFCSPHIGHO2_12_FULL_63_12]